MQLESGLCAAHGALVRFVLHLIRVVHHRDPLVRRLDLDLRREAREFAGRRRRVRRPRLGGGGGGVVIAGEKGVVVGSLLLADLELGLLERALDVRVALPPVSSGDPSAGSVPWHMPLHDVAVVWQ